MAKKQLKKDFTPDEWAEKLKNSSYQRAKRNNREAWLSTLLKLMRPAFDARGITLADNIRVTFGWTTRLEHCDPRSIGATLVHELIHTVPKCMNHGKLFQKHMGALGLEGKPNATCGGPELWAWLDPLLSQLGEFPGSEIALLAGKKKQTTRMVKCECPECGFKFRAARAPIEQAALDGLLRCPAPACGGHIEVEIVTDGEEE